MCFLIPVSKSWHSSPRHKKFSVFTNLEHPTLPVGLETKQRHICRTALHPLPNFHISQKPFESSPPHRSVLSVTAGERQRVKCLNNVCKQFRLIFSVFINQAFICTALHQNYRSPFTRLCPSEVSSQKCFSLDEGRKEKKKIHKLLSKVCITQPGLEDRVQPACDYDVISLLKQSESHVSISTCSIALKIPEGLQTTYSSSQCQAPARQLAFVCPFLHLSLKHLNPAFSRLAKIGTDLFLLLQRLIFQR